MEVVTRRLQMRSSESTRLRGPKAAPCEGTQMFKVVVVVVVCCGGGSSGTRGRSVFILFLLSV